MGVYRGVALDNVRINSVRWAAPVVKTASFSLGSEQDIICNGSGIITITLPAASSVPGRSFRVRTIAAFTVVSASANVVPLTGAAAAAAILAATPGAWAEVTSDGTNWLITAA